jgi:hypothetical protein
MNGPGKRTKIEGKASFWIAGPMAALIAWKVLYNPRALPIRFARTRASA